MPESFAGITVPDGEPEQVFSAGAVLSGVSGGLEGVSAQLRGMPELLASWRGPASISYGNSCLTNGTALSAAERALSRCAVVAQRYARDLEEAQDDARSAIKDAREAQRRIDRAQAQLTEARDAGAAAVLRGADASAEVLISGLTGSPNAGAMSDLDAARADADAAAKREGAAKRELEGAEEDLRAAQKRGERAEEAADDAAQAAAGAFEGLASASPAAVYAGQVAQAREAERVKAEAEEEDDGGPFGDALKWASGAAEDVGNTTSGFTNELSFGLVDLGGDKDSGAYKTGQVASYVPWNPASALKSAGTGAFKLGAKALGKDAAKEGAETTAKRNADDATGAVKPGPGTPRQVNEAMSERAARYQQQVTGSPRGQAYDVGGVKFDGFKDGALQEAKGPGYATFAKDGKFQEWFRGQDALVEQARRQAAAAGDTPVRWSVAEPEAAEAIKRLLRDEGLPGIDVRHVPPPG